MVIMHRLFLCIVLFICVDEIVGPLAPTWGLCECRWDAWAPWSSCTQTCYGLQYRDRKVWIKNTPGCDEFTDCASNDMGREWKSCNEFCHNGGTFVSSSTGCSCIPGKYGRCCDKTVTCAVPLKPSNCDLAYTSTVYDSIVTYTCHTDYNMTEGTNARTCQADGGWSGTRPTCRYVNTCSSKSCLNGATCINGIEMYTCHCQPGWSGQNCENDVQSPVMTDCSGDKLIHTSETTVKVEWLAPQFTDPFGNDIQVIKNYASPSMVAPWGDYVVQYVATKHSNGLQTKCNFNINVRPHPCPFNIPSNGARVCNGWAMEYAQVCLVYCSDGFSLDIGNDPRQWYVCGASGNWLPGGILPNCSMPMVNIDSVSNVQDYQYVSCQDTSIKDTYISKLKTSLERSLCDKHPDECNVNNVIVDC